jgi:sulfite exporter TauE/SafE
MIKQYLSTNWLSVLLYALLGFMLGVVGVSIMNRVGEFLSILFIVIAIDVNSAYLMFKSMSKDE